MAKRFDIILFGASGFTGKHTIPYIHKFANVAGRDLTWGVAGRSESKIKDALQEMETRAGLDFSSVPILLADVTDEDSLKKLAGQAKCIINCCGPYRFYGEAVVKACVEMGTHHVDVSGEPQYMEQMQLKYSQQAEEKKIYIVSACGFDSIPTDLGVVFLQNKFEGTLNSVETYLTGDQVDKSLPGPTVNYGTWESAVYGLAYANELRGLRTKLFPKRLPLFSPKLMNRRGVHKSKEGRWSVPFLGSDRSVVMRSQRHFYDVDKQRPVQVQTYLSVMSIFHILIMSIYGAIFLLFTKFQFGQKLLLKYPSLFSGGYFSHEEPTEEKQENTLFSITLYGEGWGEKITDPNATIDRPVEKSIVGKVSGKNPGYGATCLALTLAAVTILTEPEKLPTKGGVYPPGAVFAKTSIMEVLNENGVKFEILQQSKL